VLLAIETISEAENTIELVPSKDARTSPVVVFKLNSCCVRYVYIYIYMCVCVCVCVCVLEPTAQFCNKFDLSFALR